MIGSRKCNALKTLSAVYSYCYYLLDTKHPRHEGMSLEAPNFWGLDEAHSLTGLKVLEKQLDDGYGYSLAESIRKLSEVSPLPSLKSSALEDLLEGREGLDSGEARETRDAILSLGSFLSKIAAAEGKFLAQGGAKGMSLVEQLSVSPAPGKRYTPEQRRKLDQRIFSTLGENAVGLSVWHIGKRITYQGLETFRDDAHYLLCDFVDGPRVQRRTTALANYRSNNCLKLFQQVLERFTFEMHVEISESGNPAPLESVRLSKPQKPHPKNDTLDEINVLLQDEEPSISQILELVRPRGWRSGEVEKGKNKTKHVAFLPPGHNSPVFFPSETFCEKLLERRGRRCSRKRKREEEGGRFDSDRRFDVDRGEKGFG